MSNRVQSIFDKFPFLPQRRKKKLLVMKSKSTYSGKCSPPQTKRTVLIITQSSCWVRLEPSGLFICCPLINLPAFLSAFITVGMERALQLPVLGSPSTTLTPWPSGLSHTFRKPGVAWKCSRVHKLFLFFSPLPLALVVERRFWASTDGCLDVFLSVFVWVWMLRWLVYKCYFPFFKRWLV